MRKKKLKGFRFQNGFSGQENKKTISDSRNQMKTDRKIVSD